MTQSRRSVVRTIAAGGVSVIGATGTTTAACLEIGDGLGELYRQCGDWEPPWARWKVAIDLDYYDKPYQQYAMEHDIDLGGDKPFYDTNTLSQIEKISLNGLKWKVAYEEGEARPATEIFYLGEAATDVRPFDDHKWDSLDPWADLRIEEL